MRLPNPEARIWKQTNSGETPWDANLVGSFNVDLSRRPGKISAAPRMKQAFNTTDNADLSTPLSFLYFEEQYWAFSRRVYRTGGTSNPRDSWEQVTLTDTPSLSDSVSDAVIFDNGIVVTRDTSGSNVDRYTTSGGWTTGWLSIPLTILVAHPMETITIGSPVLCIGNGNVLATVTGSGSYTYTAARLTLDPSQRIKWIRAGTSQAYIGTQPRRDAGRGMVYIWDGGSTQPTRSIELNSRGACSAVVHDDILYIVTVEGEIQRLDGSGFTTVGKFPVFNTGRKPLAADAQQLNRLPVHQRGSAVRRGKILFNLQGGLMYNDTLYVPYNNSGIWEYDPQTGSLSHKYGFGNNKDGDGDFGQPFAADASRNYCGAIMTQTMFGDITLLAGFGYTTTSSKSSNTAVAIFYDDIDETQPTVARVVFPQAFTKDISGFHNTVVLKYQPMRNATDQIVVKYRTTEKDPITANVTWTNATTFTTTTDISKAVVGEEVFVLQANGGGDSAQITNISETSGTYTVTLSRSIIGVSASNTGKVTIQNWKLLDSFNDMVGSTRNITAPTDAGAWLQVMVELRGTPSSPILEEVAVLDDKSQQL